MRAPLCAGATATAPPAASPVLARSPSSAPAAVGFASRPRGSRHPAPRERLAPQLAALVVSPPFPPAARGLRPGRAHAAARPLGRSEAAGRRPPKGCSRPREAPTLRKRRGRAAPSPCSPRSRVSATELATPDPQGRHRSPLGRSFRGADGAARAPEPDPLRSWVSEGDARRPWLTTGRLEPVSPTSKAPCQAAGLRPGLGITRHRCVVASGQI